MAYQIKFEKNDSANQARWLVYSSVVNDTRKGDSIVDEIGLPAEWIAMVRDAAEQYNAGGIQAIENEDDYTLYDAMENAVGQAATAYSIQKLGKQMISKFDGCDVFGRNFRAGTPIYYYEKKALIA